MSSSLAWLDYSDAQRRQMLELVDQFREKGTLDELGFGSIRDSFADHFFPGTSTIQTRARYLLFVPWIYLTIERERVPYSQVDKRARSDQARLVAALQRGGAGDSDGIIGIQAGQLLQRTPAAIYWGALRRYRIWRFGGTLANYYAAAYREGRARAALRSDDGELVERERMVGWHQEMPAQPPGLLEEADLKLSREEADYLRERIAAEARDTLLMHCVNGSRRTARIEFPWQHPDYAGFPVDLRRELEQARRFSSLAYGVVLLYNLMLAEKMAEGQDEGVSALIEQRRDQLGDWAVEVAADGNIRDWQIEHLWAVVSRPSRSIRPRTRDFVGRMLEIIRPNPHALATNDTARRLVEHRELDLKGGLARLSNRRALERYSGSAGLARQSFRWPNARLIITDIQSGLSSRGGADA